MQAARVTEAEFRQRAAELIEVGRALWAWGAHARGFNHCSVGVCLAGGARKANEGETPDWGEMMAEDNFDIGQRVELVGVLGHLRSIYPGAVVVGHNELNPRKACPSFDVGAFVHRSHAEQVRVAEVIARIRRERDV